MVSYCSECKNVYRCTRMNGDGVPVICKNREGNLIHSVFREHIPGDLYADPLGEPYEPYKGLSTFIQTPMADPVRPRTADELLREKMKNTGRTPLIDSE